MTLIISVRDLVRKPGNMREITVDYELSENFGTDLVFVPKGEKISLDLRLESVHEGILVTASGTALAVAECARCLDPVTLHIEIYFQDLFHYQSQDEDDFVVFQDSIDLEQPLIDAVVPNLPLKPLCSEDCAGLCAGCGEKLKPGEQHEHEAPIDPRFSALKDFGKD
jgi:uncharacterized protein